MAKANYNATLEYATNTLEFWLTDDAGGEMPFDSQTKFRVEHMDDVDKNMEWSFVSNTNGHIVFSVTPTETGLARPGDSMYAYVNVEFNHMYSVRGDTEVYVSGLMNLVRTA